MSKGLEKWPVEQSSAAPEYHLWSAMATVNPTAAALWLCQWKASEICEIFLEILFTCQKLTTKKKLEACVILQLIDILKRGVYMASLSAY